MQHADAPTHSPTQASPEARILAAAAEVFLRDGFAGASVDSVAALARMSKVSIYSQFPNKAALFEAAVRATIDRHGNQLPDIAGRTGVEQGLAALGNRMFERFIDPVNFGLFRANIEAANQFPDLASELHRHRLQGSRRSSHFLQVWVDEGQLRLDDGLSGGIRFSALCVQGTRHFLGFLPPLAEERARIVQRVITLFLDGYEAASTGAAPIWPPASPLPQPSHGAIRLPPARVELLLDAIRDEFLEHGYRGASIDRAVATVGAGKTTVYRQFGNKDAVFRHVVERIIHAEERRNFGRSEPTLSVTDDLCRLTTAVLQAHCARENILVHRMLIQAAGQFPELARKFYLARVNRLGQCLVDLLVRHGRAVPDSDVVGDFYNLATSALRFLTSAELPDAAGLRVEAREVANIFLLGVRS